MTPLAAVTYSLLFGLLHGILPDEHTWPITFSYAIGGASGKEGVKASLYFSAAFTLQRMLISELAYLALAPFILSASVNGVVYIVVGIAMSAAGAVVLSHGNYPHLHLVGHHHEEETQRETTGALFGRTHSKAEVPASPRPRWAVIHGFIAGFGFGGFSLFVNGVAAPAMSSPFLGFLPGLAFGLGTAVSLIIIGALFGASLRWVHSLSESEIKRIGAQTGGRTLFFGGLLFGVAGVVTLLGLDRQLPIDPAYALIGTFMIVIAIPAFIYSLKEVLATRDQPPAAG